MNNSPSKLVRFSSKLAAVLLAVIVMAVAYFVFLHWWFVAPLLNMDSQMRGLEQIHAKYAAAIAAEPLLEKRVSQLKRHGVTAGAFLSAKDPSTASAELIQRATRIVASQSHGDGGCSMPSKMPLDQDGEGSSGGLSQRVSISITLDCGLKPLAAVLYGFSHDQPYLFVDNLMISRSPDGSLQAQISLSGYVHPKETP